MRAPYLLAVGAGLLVIGMVGRDGKPALLLQPVRPALLVDMFPPTPQWDTTPGSVGQVGNGETPAKGQEINVLGGGYQFPDYARQQAAVMEIAFGRPSSLAWETTPNSIGAVGSGEEPAPGQDINVLGGDYVFPSYVRSGVRTGRLGAGMGAGRPSSQALLFPRAPKLWGGQYSSVGEFPKGYNGQRSYGGEWNVWALPTAEQMEEHAECDEPCIDGPLASIGERNALEGLGNDPDSPVWQEDAGDQPAGTTGNCCGSALGEAGGFEEPSHAWLSA